MPNLSWNEIRNRAVLFARDWSSAAREQADKQTFWNEFFDVFGIPRRTVASFEEPVRRLRGTYGFIDLLWRGTLLVEHKSVGASLQAAETQAFDYIHDLQTVGRGDEIPRYILLSDFQRFALYDLEPDEQLDLPLFRNRRFTRREFTLAELPEYIKLFAFIPGYQLATPYKPQDPLNLKAVELMAGVHDTLKAGGFSGHDLMRFLVRVLFCMFAEKTGIFQPDAFRLFIENRTSPDGSNLGAQLNELFATLDKPEDRRQKNLDEDLRSFPYVNGALFSERLDSAAFTGPMRQALLNAANYKWAQISPAIFGALFQEVMKPEDRRKIGAHYTSERDILKVIHPLFLDKLREEFTSIQQDRSGRRSGRLEEFRVKLTQLRFLDPACGCGNFLVIAYRELRALELEVLKAQHSTQQAFTLGEVSGFSQVNVHQFYGIEIDEWPARIAEVALWLTDHQANLQILAAFGQPYLRLPLRQSPHIRIDNALRIDWNSVLPANECSYVFGNPPFVGKAFMSDGQRADMASVVREAACPSGTGILDYVCAWYIKGALFVSETAIPIAFVSTNSIAQGEQPGILWSFLYSRGFSLEFAYPTFVWTSEAKKKAHVHVVIEGFSRRKGEQRRLFRECDNVVQAETVSNISPYLAVGPNVTLIKRRSTISSGAPEISFGNMSNDGGHFFFDKTSKAALLRDAPQASAFLRPFVSSEDFLNGGSRSCLWLVGVAPSVIREIPAITERIQNVQRHRAKSKRKTTAELASSPTLFAEIRQPISTYLAIPKTSSETRMYIPMGFLPASTIVSTELLAIDGAGLDHFGVLTSSMHMAWVRQVAGRLKSDYRYSAGLVYNNYPWPEHPTPAQKAKVEELAQAVLDARALYPDSTLAQLYDPLLMPPELTKAHHALDRAVERCYRAEPFASDRERVEYLFTLYEKLTAPLLPAVQKKSSRARKAAAANSVA